MKMPAVKEEENYSGEGGCSVALWEQNMMFLREMNEAKRKRLESKFPCTQGSVDFQVPFSD